MGLISCHPQVPSLPWLRIQCNPLFFHIVMSWDRLIYIYINIKIYIYRTLFPTKSFQSSYWLIYRLHIHGFPIYSFRNPNPINSWMLMDLSWIFPSFSICFRHRHSCNPLQWPLCSSSLKVSTARCQQRALAMPCSSPLQVCLASWKVNYRNGPINETQGKTNRKLGGLR
jgi:hypothetical protein